MGMSAGGGSGSLNNEINVTPMIDVLLVLLIIFMMIIPMSRKAIDTQLPDPNPQPQTSQVNPDQIVLEILPDDKYAINKEPVERAQLFNRLKTIYDPRPEKIIFIKGDTMAIYENVIWAMDQARGAGVKVLGVAPK
ncbi:ExbD/TolR family protein [Gemmatimonas sp.]|jgi:biopolymer transport protein TolR|uniref:ExbD/TolR family protein n=1 Tax=Gemmatimonas sp. TaxID=1962908 RepID=UPI0031C36AF7|nr:biopolymer transporter ExbD [Gemmatimonas sp.]